MKTILKIAIFIILFVFIPSSQASDVIDLHFFYGDGCPHCAKEEVFLDKLEAEMDNIEIHRYEVWNNRDNAGLLAEAAEKLNVTVSGVPFLVIGGETVAGYYNEEVTGAKIRSIIKKYEVNECTDLITPLMSNDCEHGCSLNETECPHDCGCAADNESVTTLATEEDNNKINLPAIGEVALDSFSLPVLTIIIAAIDGFNPCAMWVLLFLISLLIGMEDKRRRLILGIAFIAASAFVYFLFLSAWLKMFMFLGFVWWIRFIIGAVAIGSGTYQLREYFQNKEIVCKVTKNEDRKKIFDKLKDIATEKSFLIALFGIIVLAFAVNLVELVCSAGLPAVYTQVLTLSNLPAWKYYGYLLLYIFIFMLDDLIVFSIAMATLQMKAISAKYTRYAGLIGGVVILVIGILLWFKPGWLMFG